MVLDREAQGLAAAAAQLSQPETSAACSSGGQHSSPSAEDIQSIYLIIGMQVRAIMPSEATVCARGSETYIFSSMLYTRADTSASLAAGCIAASCGLGVLNSSKYPPET